MGSCESDEVDAAVAEQVRYYRARAPEYDDWWNRRGRYDRGREFAAVWNREIAEVERELSGFDPAGRVLEIAAGTGNWTRRLVAHADSVTALDSSAEALAINREKLGEQASKVLWRTADVFDHEPEGIYDVVFLGFWLSHVPVARLGAFWRLVDRASGPRTRLFLVDNAHPARASTAPGSPLEIHPESQTVSTAEGTVDLAGATAMRTLTDGRRFGIVKRYWRPEELVSEVARFGWAVEARTTEHFFLIAHGQPAG